MKSKKENGITLIELLVGVAIFSVIASSLSMTFANGVMFSRKAQARDSVVQDAHWTVEALRRDLENLVPYSQGPGGNSFRGETDSLSFVISTEKGLRRVCYFAAPKEDVRIHEVLVRHLEAGSAAETGSTSVEKKQALLVRAEQPFPLLDEGDADDETEQEVLSFYIIEESLRFSYAYWADDAQAGGLSWDGQWDRQGLPAGVRFRGDFVNVSGNTEPLAVRQNIAVPLGLKGLLPGTLYQREKVCFL